MKKKRSFFKFFIEMYKEVIISFCLILFFIITDILATIYIPFSTTLDKIILPFCLSIVVMLMILIIIFLTKLLIRWIRAIHFCSYMPLNRKEMSDLGIKNREDLFNLILVNCFFKVGKKECLEVKSFFSIEKLWKIIQPSFILLSEDYRMKDFFRDLESQKDNALYIFEKDKK